MFKTFIILRYFHIQTSAIKRKYPTLIVRIFLVSARTYSYSNTLRSQAKRSEVSKAWNIPCSSEGRVALLSVT